jgi:hypothetical protein
MVDELVKLPSKRSQIIAKAYGSEFGRGDLVIQSLSEVLEDFPTISAYLYSVTDDLIDAATDLQQRFPGRVEFWSRRNPLSRSEISQLFQNSRIYTSLRFALMLYFSRGHFRSFEICQSLRLTDFILNTVSLFTF